MVGTLVSTCATMKTIIAVNILTGLLSLDDAQVWRITGTVILDTFAFETHLSFRTFGTFAFAGEYSSCRTAVHIVRHWIAALLSAFHLRSYANGIQYRLAVSHTADIS